MYLGKKNATQTFQRLMHLDDVLVVSQDRDLHLEHLHVVLDLMVQNGLVLYKITPAGISPLHRHVDALPL